jgi:omega-6 fatty acid desaturase / acyl-lipid omega-6 desaturase (Delta-12 desaturase)
MHFGQAFSAPVDTRSRRPKYTIAHYNGIDGGTTAVPRRMVLQWTVTASTVDSSPSTAAASPNESPRQSPSSTFLSSMSSIDDLKSNSYRKLIDTYGNEFELPDYTINDIRNAIPKHLL